MRIRQGWSGEVSPGRWAKFDVELEEDDLLRMMREAGVPANVTVPDAYRLLEAEAERLVLVKLTTRYRYPADEARTRIADLLAAQQEVLNKYHGKKE